MAVTAAPAWGAIGSLAQGEAFFGCNTPLGYRLLPTRYKTRRKPDLKEDLV